MRYAAKPAAMHFGNGGASDAPRRLPAGCGAAAPGSRTSFAGDELRCTPLQSLWSSSAPSNGRGSRVAWRLYKDLAEFVNQVCCPFFCSWTGGRKQRTRGSCGVSAWQGLSWVKGQRSRPEGMLFLPGNGWTWSGGGSSHGRTWRRGKL